MIMLFVVTSYSSYSYDAWYYIKLWYIKTITSDYSYHGSLLKPL